MVWQKTVHVERGAQSARCGKASHDLHSMLCYVDAQIDNKEFKR
ncbi:hypothetical protein B0I21_101181 [Sphingobacterium paludis]|uniref:Uncharacterized protein n=1 Tax=Sphingobacterium paludis TaxID=1476465 RepID=A0A4R7D9A7_9SPHI|nr:hypothetical protein B0I21_101181 [Sphingobacterium paludis]